MEFVGADVGRVVGADVGAFVAFVGADVGSDVTPMPVVGALAVVCRQRRACRPQRRRRLESL